MLLYKEMLGSLLCPAPGVPISGQGWDWDMGTAFLPQLTESVDLSCHCEQH